MMKGEITVFSDIESVKKLSISQLYMIIILK